MSHMKNKSILFLQDDMVERGTGLERKFYPAVRWSEKPIMKPEQPWELGGIYVFGSILKEDDGRLRMWYQAVNDEGPTSLDHFSVCYAESRDGIKWNRPMLGISSYRNTADTNIVIGNAIQPGNPYCPSVIRIADGTYRATVWYEDWSDKLSSFSGAAVFSSADGLHWKILSGADPFIEAKKGGPNDVNCLSPDLLDGRHVSFQVFQRYVTGRKKHYKRDLITGRERVISMQSSSDFIRWSEPELIFVPENDDPDFLQFYGMAGFRYAQYWLGTIWVYYVHDQTMNVELVVSLDGKSWERCAPGYPLIELGSEDSFDWGMITTATAPVIVGNDIYLYYGGFNRYHDGKGISAIGLACIKEDRWAGLKTGKLGSFQTKRFKFTGSRILLNARARSGEIRVGIINLDGDFIKGFKPSDFDVFSEDKTCHYMTWNGKTDLLRFKGEYISLYFELANAEVFSFSIEE